MGHSVLPIYQVPCSDQTQSEVFRDPYLVLLIFLGLIFPVPSKAPMTRALSVQVPSTAHHSPPATIYP